MKIYIPILGFGKAGGFRVLSNLANQWIKLGHETYFICIPNKNLNYIPYYPTNATILYFNLNGELISDLKEFNKFSKSIFFRLRQLYGLTKAINKHTTNEDIILANYSLTAYSVYFSKKNCNKFYYIQAYEPEYFDNSLKGNIFSALVTLTYKLKLIRIVNSPLYFNYKYLKSNFCVFPGIDFSIFNNNNKPPFFSNKKHIIIGCIGRIEKSKGTIDVLNAYKILQTHSINCILKIAVFGNENLIDGDKSIIKIYPKNDIELSEFYKNLDLLIAPVNLQLGAVHYPVIEAMSTGTAVISTGHYPANEDNAWLVPINSPAEIANRVIEIYNKPSLAFNKSLIAFADVQNLSWESVSNNMINIFQKN
jgi:glycosyltransferase involved in cell wall biosynthesis